MHSPIVAFLTGLSAAGLASLAYIGPLRAKVASYELYIRYRIDKQMAALPPLNVHAPSGHAGSISPRETPHSHSSTLRDHSQANVSSCARAS